jgi:hypothetical protein
VKLPFGGAGSALLVCEAYRFANPPTGDNLMNPEVSSTEATAPNDQRTSYAVAARQTWRDSHWLAACEFALIAAVFYADARAPLPVSKVSYLFLIEWASLLMRRPLLSACWVVRLWNR